MLSVVFGNPEQIYRRFPVDGALLPDRGEGTYFEEWLEATEWNAIIDVPVEAEPITGHDPGQLKDAYYNAMQEAYAECGCKSVAVLVPMPEDVSCTMEEILGAAAQGVSEMLFDYMADETLSVYLVLDNEVLSRMADSPIRGEERRREDRPERDLSRVFYARTAGGNCVFRPEKYRETPDAAQVPAACYVPEKGRKTPCERLADWYDENKAPYKLPELPALSSTLSAYLSRSACGNFLSRNRKGNIERRKAVVLAMGMGLNEDRTRELLAVCGYLFGSEDEDKIFAYCIKNYPDPIERLDAANQFLFHSSMVPLNSDFHKRKQPARLINLDD